MLNQHYIVHPRELEMEEESFFSSLQLGDFLIKKFNSSINQQKTSTLSTCRTSNVGTNYIIV